MDKELEKMLFENYSKMFKQKDLPMQIGNGWFLIVLDVCMCIQHYIDDNKMQQMEITQIKKEYNELKIYTEGSDTLIQGMIWLTEYISWHTCEVCGSTMDIVHKNYGTITLCENCDKEKERYESNKWL